LFVEHLKALSEGRSTFVPAVSAAGELPPPVAPPPEGVTAAMDVVRCDDARRPLVASLLGEVRILPDLAAARAHADGDGRAFTLVTLDGEVLRPDGSVTRGVLEGPAVGALQKKREIAELQLEVKALEEQYTELLTRHYSLQKQMGHTEGVLKGLAKHQHAEELSLAGQEKDLHQAGAELSRLRERLQVLDKEDAHRGQLLHGQADRDRRDERARLWASELESLRARAEGASEKLTALRVKVAQSAERGEAAKAEIARLRATAEEISARLTKLEEVINQGAAR